MGCHVSIKDRTYRLKTYPRSFIASEAVDWMVSQEFDPRLRRMFPALLRKDEGRRYRREEALAFFQGLLSRGVFRHVESRITPFLDEFSLFTFEELSEEEEPVRRASLSSPRGDGEDLVLDEQTVMDICGAIRDKGSGFEVKERTYRLSKWPESFVGSEAVDWLAKKYSLSRHRAVEVGSLLFSLKVFYHVEHSRMFADDYVLYRFAAGTVGLLKSIPMSEVQKHKTKEDAWVVVYDIVYDITSFASIHPGGEEVLWPKAGCDVSRLFAAQQRHQVACVDPSVVLAVHLRGCLAGSPLQQRVAERLAAPPPSGSEADPATLLTYDTFTLTAASTVNYNTRYLRFVGPSLKGQDGGHQAGCYAMLKARIHGVEVMRPYTPLGRVKDNGGARCHEFIVKVYPDGVMSRFLHRLSVGDCVSISEPIPTFPYVTVKKRLRHLAMIAGGTGIAPMLSSLDAILSQPESERPAVTVVYANRTALDILRRDQLDTMAKQANVSVTYLLSQPPSGWPYDIGHLTEGHLKAKLPQPSPETHVLLCGPPGFEQHVSNLLDRLGFPKEAVYTFPDPRRHPPVLIHDWVEIDVP